MAGRKKAETVKRKMGRPRLEIDFNIVDAMVAAFATQQEIADYLGVSVDTLERRFKAERKVTFAEYFKKNNAHRKMALRRWQAEAARKGNVAMLIFLGKNYLGQRDTPPEQYAEAMNRQPASITYIEIDGNTSDETTDQIPENAE